MLEHDRRWYRNPDLIASSLLVVLGVLFFADVLFTSKNFYFRDILNFHYPLRKVLIDSYARGEWPLWNPYVYLGQPMLANPNYMAFYPSNLFHLFLPFNYAFKLHFVIHPILASLGIYFLQRRLNLPPLACFGGAVVYAFSGTVLSFLNLYNILPAVALLPWIGWAFLRTLRAKSGGSILLFGILVALQIIAFEPLMAQCSVLLIVGISILYLLESDDRRAAWHDILRSSLLGGLFGIGIAAAQVLPTLELLPRSARGSQGYDFKMVSSWSMHPMDFVNAIIPNFFGNPYTIGWSTYWGEAYHNGREGYLVSFFLGTSAVLLAIMSLASRRKTTLYVLCGLGFASAFLALGRFNPAYRCLYHSMGFLNLGRYPSKYFLLATLAVSLLVALGIEAVIEQKPRERMQARNRITVVGIAGICAGAAIIACWAVLSLVPYSLLDWIRTQAPAQPAQTQKSPIIVAQLLRSILSSGIFLLAAAAILLASLRSKRPQLIGRLLVFLVVAELIPPNVGLSPLISDADVDLIPEVFGHIRQIDAEGQFRVLTPRLLQREPQDVAVKAPNQSIVWLQLHHRMSGMTMSGIATGIQIALDLPVDGLNLRESDELYRICTRLSDADRISLARRLNVRKLLVLKEMRVAGASFEQSFDTRSNYPLLVYDVPDARPRVYFVSQADFVSSPEEAFRRFTELDDPQRDSVILERRCSGQRSARAGQGIAKTAVYEPQRVVCTTESNTDGYLVLLDSYYPGWKAYVDGKEVEILRANYCFRAVHIVPGKHLIEFKYRPRSFFAGLAVTCLTLLVGLWVGLRRCWRSLKRPLRARALRPVI